MKILFQLEEDRHQLGQHFTASCCPSDPPVQLKSCFDASIRTHDALFHLYAMASLFLGAKLCGGNIG